MTETTYRAIERYMLAQMKDSAHDSLHIYRVLSGALQIAQDEPGTDLDILVAASLLHDVGRERQRQNPLLCHAQEGAEMAEAFLLEELGWPPERAGWVADCVRTHRYRKNREPRSIEAQIVFDADKLDVTGAIGIARTLNYGGQVGEPLYLLDEAGELVLEGGGGDRDSFLQEFDYKLKGLYSCFYTPKGAALAADREANALGYYNSLLKEIRDSEENRLRLIGKLLKD